MIEVMLNDVSYQVHITDEYTEADGLRRYEFELLSEGAPELTHDDLSSQELEYVEATIRYAKGGA